MVAQLVRYNGTPDLLEVSDGDASQLVPGAMYSVVKEVKHDWYTGIMLKGFPGEFNSAIFDKVQDGPEEEKVSTMWAFSRYIPKPGTRIGIVIEMFNNIKLQSPVPRIITVIRAEKLSDREYMVTDNKKTRYHVTVV